MKPVRKSLMGCLGFLLLIGGCGTCISMLNRSVEDTRNATAETEAKETARRATLTPEQRAAEDAQKAAENKRQNEKEAELAQQRGAKEAEAAKKREWENKATEAGKTAKDYVKTFLKFPQDASFPWLPPDVRGREGSNVFWASSTVKAKNAFGAELTYPWKACVILKDTQWELDYCELNGEVVYLSPAATKAVEKLADTLSETEEQASSRMQAEEKKQQAEETAKQQADKLAARRAKAAKLREAASKNRPELAANSLKVGKQLAEAGKAESAEKWYRKVIDQYPETEAAAEARTKLGEAPLAVVPTADGLRTWTDAAGKKLEAYFVSFADGRVTLKRQDGRTLNLPLEKLSPADQQFVQQATSRVAP